MNRKRTKTSCSQCIFHRPSQCWNNGDHILPVHRQGASVACYRFQWFEPIIKELRAKYNAQETFGEEVE